jgi:hypothetical protein
MAPIPDGAPAPNQQALAFALDKYPERVEMIPIDQKRPAYVKIAVPDEVVKGLKGKAEEADLVLLVRVPREVLARRESRIILPGEVR